MARLIACHRASTVRAHLRDGDHRGEVIVVQASPARSLRAHTHRHALPPKPRPAMPSTPVGPPRLSHRTAAPCRVHMKRGNHPHSLHISQSRSFYLHVIIRKCPTGYPRSGADNLPGHRFTIGKCSNRTASWLTAAAAGASGRFRTGRASNRTSRRRRSASTPRRAGVDLVPMGGRGSDSRPRVRNCRGCMGYFRRTIGIILILEMVRRVSGGSFINAVWLKLM
jgi:hypothetical protein